MNNNYRNYRGRRIGAKKPSANRTAIVWGVAGLIWIAYMIDLVMTRDPWWLMLIYTIGVFLVAFLIAKPGKFAERAYREGFWRTLWRTLWNTITFNKSSRRRRGRERGRGRYYRR